MADHNSENTQIDNTPINPLSLPLPKKPQQQMIWHHLHGSAIGLALSNAIERTDKPVLIISDDTLKAERLVDELSFFYQGTKKIIAFPDWETLPYDSFSPHQDIVSRRLAALKHLSQQHNDVIVTSISTVMHRVSPPTYLTQSTFLLATGDKLNLDHMRSQLQQAGYACVSQVREHGEYAIRGSILDLFPMGTMTPFRIDLFDDEIESIRLFSADDQRTLEKIEKIELLPAKEFPLHEEAIERFRAKWRSEFSGNPINSPIYQDITEGICTPGLEYYLTLFFDQSATLFDYLPSDSLIIRTNQTPEKANEFWREIEQRYEQYGHDIRRPLLTPKQVFIPTEELFSQINRYSHIKIELDSNQSDQDLAHTSAVPSSIAINHKAARPLAALETYLQSFQGKILFVAETAGRREVLLQLFNSIHLHPTQVHSWKDFLNSTDKYCITIAPLDESLLLTDPTLLILTEAQLFGQRIMQRRRRKETTQNPDNLIKDLAELQIGAPIVHIDHGVGRYLSLQTLNIGEQLTEFLCVEYAGGDKLYVPVASLHLINRYSGVDPEHAPLHKLGTDHWQRAKRKATEQVRDVAAELLDIYAKRESSSAFACTPPDENYRAFAATFPFEETPDQERTIEQVIADMQLNKPMDRLVCGDVGFGKTEVAMRAAFFAVQNNKQVVILVPTTLLAQQHYQNFQDRFADWPIQVDMMSRFNSAKEQQSVIEKLAAGKTDIVIGTHKLLQDHIQFKSLGLLIIDEEHLFGVRQKEKLKAFRHSVHILTLTATPIPRTLNMAFSGIRDLSIIATPPARRLSVKTFVQEHRPQIIQEAILREILRGGQVYFLHNDISTIEKVERELSQLIPEARTTVAHGQMRERELEQVMADFYHRRFNVLVCSTIIESGIDVPSANTIIINRADKFGLAQLHQLRGRVGRSHHQAYAYLLIPSHSNLSNIAKKRLEAISTYEDLGIGFTLATHDLEIRGAGEMLGEGQSGNMQDIGFTLYMDLLSRAVETLKTGKPIDLEIGTPTNCEVDLQIPALIPEKYLGDIHLRLQFYKKIASAKTTAELDEIKVEMIDRFGLLPEPLLNLFAISELKQKAEQFGIAKIEANNKNGKIEFTEKPNIDPMRIIHLIQKEANYFKLDGPTRLRFNLDPHERKERLQKVENILLKLTS